MSAMNADEEIILSDGENLSLATWERIQELRGNSNKLASKLGRTDHYARKNRTALDRIQDDLDKVDREIKRRMALTTFSFCGLTFHYQGEYRVLSGCYASKADVPKERRKDAVEVVEPPVMIVNMKTGQKTPAGPEKRYWAVKERLLVLSRMPSANKYGIRVYQPEVIHVTAWELREYMGRGAIQNRMTDPCAPWKVADIDDDSA